MSDNKEEIDYVKGWMSFGDLNVRTIEMYDIVWDSVMDFSSKRALGYPYGGAIAIFERKNFYKINIVSSAGQKISEIMYNDPPFLTVGWSFDENLIVVNTKGKVIEYRLMGEIYNEFHIEENITLKDCKFLNGKQETLLFFLSDNLKLIVKNLRKDTVINIVSLSHLNSSLKCWDCYGSTINDEHSAMFCFNSSENKIVGFKNSNISVMVAPDLFSNCCVNNISFSFDYLKVALQNDQNSIWLGSSDLKIPFFIQTFEYMGNPKSMSWFCDVGIMCVFEDNIILFGNENEKLSFPNDGFCFLIPEQDGVRIINKNSHRFIQLVPKQLSDLLLCGNNYGSVLLDSYEEYKRKEYKAIELIDKLGPNLQEAIYSCIESAGYEWEIMMQRKLLKASAFGRSFCTLSNKDIFCTTCRELRVVNNSRRKGIEIPMSISQLQSIPIELYIRRLKERKYYTFAYEISKLYKLEEEMSGVLTSWADDKIRSSPKPDAELAEDLIAKLSMHKIRSYSSVVDAAIGLKRSELAIKLIEVNCPPDLQISTLLKLEKYNLAIQIAISSGDSDLVYTVIFYLREKLEQRKFLYIIGSNPNLGGFTIKYLKEFSPDLIGAFYEETDNTKNLLGYKLNLSMTKPSELRKIALTEIEKQAKSPGIILSTIKNYSNLLERQMAIEKQMNNQFPLTGLSMIDTVISLCENGCLQLAQDIKNEFYIPDIRFYWTAVNALARSKRWKSIDELYEAKKNILKADDYANICLKYDAPAPSIEKYINKVNVEIRIDLYLNYRRLSKAAEVAVLSKKSSHVDYVKSWCKPGVNDDILNYLKKSKI